MAKWRSRQTLLSHLIIFLFENPRKTNISQLRLVGAKRLKKGSAEVDVSFVRGTISLVLYSSIKMEEEKKRS
jgi:hypothetical protein